MTAALQPDVVLGGTWVKGAAVAPTRRGTDNPAPYLNNKEDGTLDASAPILPFSGAKLQAKFC